LGARLSSGGSVDRSSVGLYALTANLAPSLDLLADVIRNPVFDSKEVERLRAQQLAGIAAQLSEPAGIANYVLPSKLYGPDHPYGRPFSGTGDAASVARITRDAVVQFHQNWLRPDNAAIYIVGDTTLAEVTALLDTRFGNWPSNRMARPVKALQTPIPVPAATKIYLVDRPQSPQSVILMGQVLQSKGTDDTLVTLRRANDVFGGNFLSRINMDLRETKGWSYGVRSRVGDFEDRVAYTINAPVQSDRTGESVKVLLDQLRDYAGAKGTTAAERDRTVNGSIRELPGQYETSAAVLGAMQQIVNLKRPDDFYEKLGARYSALTPADFDTSMRSAIDPAKFAIVVVGDAAKVKPQLDKLALPIETVQLPTAQ
jgi:zinc protease